MTATFLASGAASALDPGYADYGRLLGRHVHWIANGHASAVDYAGLKHERATLQAVLTELSSVSAAQFDGWNRDEQKAFLINAYNAFTLELILSRHPDLESIRDLGTLLRSPWKKPFFRLLGEERHLDWIEHEMLRPRYRDPRVHFAINCASIGCPALRPEAFHADRLDAQLDDQQRRFLADRLRNRFNPADGTLSVSPIFKWFTADFDAASGGLAQWFARNADALADRDAERTRLRERNFRIEFLDYDWSLNDHRRGAS